MFFSIVVGLMVLLVAMFSIRQGLFSGLIMFFETLVACLLAFTLYEPLYGTLSDTIKDPGVGEPLCLMVVFLVLLTIMRVATDKLIPGMVRMNMYVDWVGGGVCGLFTGLILVGTALIAVQMMPIGSEIVTFERFQQDASGRPVRKNVLFKPDQFVTGLLEMMSNDRFGTDESHRFARVKPDFIDTLYSMRCSTQTEARHVIPQDAVRVTAFWDERKIDHVTHEWTGSALNRTFETSEPLRPDDKFLVCRVAVNQSAANEKDSNIRFRLPQFRLIGVGGGRSEPRVYLAAGMTDLYINDKHQISEVTPEQSARLVRFDSQTNFILSAVNTKPVQSQVSDGSGGSRTGGYEFDVAFEVPDDFEPSYLEFKRGARFTFPRGDDNSLYLADPPDFASSAMGGGTIQAQSSGGSAVGRGPGGRVHVANAVAERTGVFTGLPVALDMSNPIVSRWNSGNQLRGGDGCHFSVVLPPANLDPALRVTEFWVPDDKRMLQVGAERLQAESMYGRAMSFAARALAQIYVTDSEGTQYFAIGRYSAVDIGGQPTFELQYYPDVLVTGMPERCLKAPKTVKASMLRSAGRENSKFGYIFLVDPGVTIVSFHAGARSGNSQPLNIEVGP